MRADAARLAGFTVGELRKLLSREDEEGRTFVLRIQMAESEGVNRYLKKVEEVAMDGNLKANMFMLRALRPDRFGESAPPPPAVTVTNVQATPALNDKDAKERIYMYAVELFRTEPQYLDRLQEDLKALPPTIDAQLLPERSEEDHD